MLGPFFPTVQVNESSLEIPVGTVADLTECPLEDGRYAFVWPSTSEPGRYVCAHGEEEAFLVGADGFLVRVVVA